VSPVLAAVLVVIAIVLIVSLLFIAVRFSRRRRVSPYDLQQHFLTAAERSFFGVLTEAIGNRYLVFAKVRLADLLRVRSGVSEPQAHLNRIISKHVDFLLCQPLDVSPVLVIELDDASHIGEERQARDRFVNAAFAGAGLPLLRIRAARGYDPRLLSQMIAEVMEPANAGPERPRASSTAGTDGDD
jgi:uncharacterized protein DUF2726